MAGTSALATTRIRFRRDAARLTPGQATDVRKAYAGMMALNDADERSYARFAGLHGLPLPIECQHGTPLFLPWHRAFLHSFERAMRDRVPDATLAWWNWATPDGQLGSVPSLFADERAGRAANPLFSTQVSERALQQGKDNGRPAPGPKTIRQPGIGGRRLPRASEVRALIAIPDFAQFNNALEELHGQVHVWTSGHMGLIPYAGYDPIFWAHHSMVDRLWRLWQIRHNAPGPHPSLWGQALPPFGMTVAQTLDVTLLGYDYASSTASQPVSG
jgi:tyrosinase